MLVGGCVGGCGYRECTLSKVYTVEVEVGVIVNEHIKKKKYAMHRMSEEFDKNVSSVSPHTLYWWSLTLGEWPPRRRVCVPLRTEVCLLTRPSRVGVGVCVSFWSPPDSCCGSLTENCVPRGARMFDRLPAATINVASRALNAGCSSDQRPALRVDKMMILSRARTWSIYTPPANTSKAATHRKSWLS